MGQDAVWSRPARHSGRLPTTSARTRPQCSSVRGESWSDCDVAARARALAGRDERRPSPAPSRPFRRGDPGVHSGVFVPVNELPSGWSTSVGFPAAHLAEGLAGRADTGPLGHAHPGEQPRGARAVGRRRHGGRDPPLSLGTGSPPRARSPASVRQSEVGELEGDASRAPSWARSPSAGPSRFLPSPGLVALDLVRTPLSRDP